LAYLQKQVGSNYNPFQEKLLYSAGLKLQLPRDIFEIYFPLLNQKSIADEYALRTTNYFDRMTFLLRIDLLQIQKLLRTANI